MRNFSKTKLLLIAGIVATGILAGCGNKEDGSVVSQMEPVEQPESSADTEKNGESEADADSPGEQENQSEDAGKQENDSENSKEQEKGPEASKEKTTPPEDTQNQNDTEKRGAEENTGEATELDGMVMSIGESSVTVSKIFIEPSAFGKGEVMLVGVGGDNQELINVYFEENASFVYETIRNGGKDVETREGSFLDITEGVTLHMTGRYEDEDFWADHVDISYVVLSDAW